MKLTVKKLKELIKEELDSMGTPFDDGSTPYDPQHQGKPDRLGTFRDAGCDKKAYLAAVQAVADKINSSMNIISASQRIAMYQEVLDKFPECHEQPGSTIMHNKQTQGE